MQFISRDAWVSTCLWFLALVFATATLFYMSEYFAQRFRIDQAHRELAQLQHALDKFHERFHGWPKVSTPEFLLQALHGKLDDFGRPANERWFFPYARLNFTNGNPDGFNSVILDPWGRPYRYFHLPAKGGARESYILFSAGPDGRSSSPARWVRGTHGIMPEDKDNIAVSFSATDKPVDSEPR